MAKSLYPITLRVLSAPRSLNDPFDRNIKWYYCFVLVSDLVDGLPLDANVRSAKLTGSVPRAIAATLTEEKYLFHHKNRGIVIVARDTEYKPETKKLTLMFDSKDDYDLAREDLTLDGVLDGGHTLRVCLENRENELAAEQAVMLQIRTGYSDFLVREAAGGLNTSAAVSEASLLNHEGKFDFIKEALKNQSYAETIRYKQFSGENFDISKVCQILTAMDFLNFSIRANQHPVSSYSGAGKCVNTVGSMNDHFKLYAKVLPDFLFLYDVIRGESHLSYNRDAKQEFNKVGRGGQLSFFKSTAAGVVLPFSGSCTSERMLHEACVLPMLSSLRSQLILEKGEVIWKHGFEHCLGLTRAALAHMVEDTRQRAGKVVNLNAMGKDSTYWSAMANLLVVQSVYFKPGNKTASPAKKTAKSVRPKVTAVSPRQLNKQASAANI